MPKDARIDLVREKLGLQPAPPQMTAEEFADIVAAAERAAQPENERWRKGYAETLAHAHEIIVG